MKVNKKTSVIGIPLFYCSSSIAQTPTHRSSSTASDVLYVSSRRPSTHTHTHTQRFWYTTTRIIVWAPDHEIPKTEKSISTTHGSQETFHTGAIAKLRKATVSFAMSVRPSVRMEQIGSNWTVFIEICWGVFFENLSRKFEFH